MSIHHKRSGFLRHPCVLWVLLSATCFIYNNHKPFAVQWTLDKAWLGGDKYIVRNTPLQYIWLYCMNEMNEIPGPESVNNRVYMDDLQCIEANVEGQWFTVSPRKHIFSPSCRDFFFCRLHQFSLHSFLSLFLYSFHPQKCSVASAWCSRHRASWRGCYVCDCVHCGVTWHLLW